jgi:superfamily II DNA helicase RecQ
MEALQQWRARRARGAGVPGHVLLHDGTLRALASLRPASRRELLDVPGLGPVKAARFGDELLAVVGGATREAG